MKKAYTKPEIMFEDFTLSVNIAGDCEVKTNTPAVEQCGYPIRGGVVFIDEVTACTNVPSDGVYDNFCYHVPIESNNLFNS